jgi:uncharacterized membrane protein
MTSGAGERPIRSLAKAVSWRVTGSVDTVLLSWLFTADLRIAAAIGLTEVVTKMVLYYLHERAWNRISLGRTSTVHARPKSEPGVARHLFPMKESA